MLDRIPVPTFAFLMACLVFNYAAFRAVHNGRISDEGMLLGACFLLLMAIFLRQSEMAQAAEEARQARMAADCDEAAP